MPKFPGYENKSPGNGFEWRGSSSPEGNKGNYKHPEGWKRGYRIFEDGIWEQKFFEGAFCYG